jgi:SAM-dependent methyltransferase
MDDFYDPDLYDARIGPGSRVGELYEAEARQCNGPVLDLGCGTGDVLLRVARAGLPVVGIDASAAMLGRVRERLEEETEEVRRRATLLEGRMESFAAPYPVARVFIANETLLHLTGLDALRAAIGNCFRALAPGGALVLDIPRFDIRCLGELAALPGEALRFRGRYPYRGDGYIQVWEHAAFDTDSGVIESTFRYEFLDRHGEVRQTRYRVLRLHPRRRDEVILALEAAGFVRVGWEVFHEEDGTPRFLIRGWRPGPDERGSAA